MCTIVTSQQWKQCYLSLIPDPPPNRITSLYRLSKRSPSNIFCTSPAEQIRRISFLLFTNQSDHERLSLIRLNCLAYLLKSPRLPLVTLRSKTYTGGCVNCMPFQLAPPLINARYLRLTSIISFASLVRKCFNFESCATRSASGFRTSSTLLRRWLIALNLAFSVSFDLENSQERARPRRILQYTIAPERIG